MGVKCGALMYSCVLYRRRMHDVVNSAEWFRYKLSKAEIYTQKVVVWHGGVLYAVQVELPRVVVAAL